MNLFKTKKQTSADNTLPTELFSLTHTMEDDLIGGKGTVSPENNEPMVSFQPHSSGGAAFYAAEPDASQKSEPSPFLFSAATPESIKEEKPTEKLEPKSEEPTFDPPLKVAEPPKNLPEIDVTPEERGMSLEEEPQTVAFTTENDSIQKTFALGGGFQRITSAFERMKDKVRERKILFLVLLAAFLVIIIAAVSIFYWWRSRSFGVDQLSPPPVVTAPIKENPEANLRAEPVSTSPYNATKPNVLSFDTETVSAEAIKSTLLQTGQAIQGAGIPGAVEFIIRDQKLNPLAFSRFAFLAKMNLPETLLATLDESFSLYVFIDNGRPRAVLSTTIKNVDAFNSELQKYEKDLGLAMEPFFLDTTTARKTNLSFRSGNHLERPVRFANVDSTLNLSVDYAIRGTNWIIGTSKDSLRAVLDKNSL